MSNRGEKAGQYPFTRGIYEEMYRSRKWTMRQYAGFSSASDSNKRYRYLLDQGTTGLSVAFDLPTQIGYDSDDPIAEGGADALQKVGIRSIAPSKSLARLESSKSFTRKLLEKYDVEGNPKFRTFFSEEGMEDFSKSCGEIVVKYDGLAGGKGVQVQGDHFQTFEEGLKFARECLSKSGKVVIEEKMVGQEFSLLYFCDGTSMVPMPIVQDNKRALEDDRGPNTGGMGTVSQRNFSLPFLRSSDIQQANTIAMNSMAALQAECGETFVGILYGGFMATKDGVRLVEFNVRFGDPEALNILPLLSTDFVEVCEAMLSGSLSSISVDFLQQATVCKYVVPEGYPDAPAKNVPIEIDESSIPENVEVFYASVEEKEDKIFLKGSRAIAFTGIADTIAEAQFLAEEATKSVTGPVFHRSDIGTEALMKKRSNMMDRIRGE